MTNATKANLIAVINAVLLCATLFGLELTDAQVAGIMGVANALGVLAVGITYKDSPKRIPE
jgi:urea transporter